MKKSRRDLEDELKKAQARIAELEQLVMTDELTRLPNLRGILPRLSRAIMEFDRGRPFALVMVDVDHFKSVNDTYGHKVGDKVLQHVASVLNTASRGVDFVGRYGGEEFCMVLPDVDSGAAVAVAERVRAALEYSLCGDLAVTASFGVCAYREGLSQNSLWVKADAALYRAKQGGRNRVVSGDFL